jgi:hypothetical protein
MSATNIYGNDMQEKKVRKRYIPLNKKVYDVCIKMANEGKTSAEIAEFSGQGIRNAQRILKHALEANNPDPDNKMDLTKRGPKKMLNDDLQRHIVDILTADNSLTIKGNLII